MKILRKLFCRHEWDQRYWGGNESGYMCVRCGRIEYRQGPGGPEPAGTSREPKPTDSAEVKP